MERPARGCRREAERRVVIEFWKYTNIMLAVCCNCKQFQFRNFSQNEQFTAWLSITDPGEERGHAHSGTGFRPRDHRKHALTHAYTRTDKNGGPGAEACRVVSEWRCRRVCRCAGRYDRGRRRRRRGHSEGGKDHRWTWFRQPNAGVTAPLLRQRYSDRRPAVWEVGCDPGRLSKRRIVY